MPGSHQHIIPQFYLKSFLEPGWIYRKGKLAPRFVHTTKDVAVSENYYGKNDLEGSSVDEVNTEIENKCCKSFRILISDSSQLTTYDNELLNFFFANLFLRNKSNIDEWRSVIINISNEVKDTMKQQRCDSGKVRLFSNDEATIVSTDELFHHADMLSYKAGSQIAAKDNLGAFQAIAECIKNMSFLILEAPDEFFS